MQEPFQKRPHPLHNLILTDFFGKFHDLKGVLLLAVFKNALVDRIVHTHADHADDADHNAQYEAAGGIASDLPHGEAHSYAQNKGRNNAEAVSKDGSGELGSCVQFFLFCRIMKM